MEMMTMIRIETVTGSDDGDDVEWLRYLVERLDRIDSKIHEAIELSSMNRQCGRHIDRRAVSDRT